MKSSEVGWIIGLVVVGVLGTVGVAATLVAVRMADIDPRRSERDWTSSLPALDERPMGSGRLTRAMLAEMDAYPGVADRFGGYSYAQGYAEGQRLSSRGLARLEDSDVMRLTQLRSQIIEGSDAACEAMGSGRNPSAVMRGIEGLSDPDLRDWARITARAMYLESRGGPRPMTAAQMDAAIERGFDRVHDGLTPEERERWDGLGEEMSPAESCFVERVTHRAVLAMPEREGAGIMRALFELASQG